MKWNDLCLHQSGVVPRMHLKWGRWLLTVNKFGYFLPKFDFFLFFVSFFTLILLNFGPNLRPIHTCTPMMSSSGNGYDRHMLFIHKKWSTRYNTIWYVTFFEVFGHKRWELCGTFEFWKKQSSYPLVFDLCICQTMHYALIFTGLPGCHSDSFPEMHFLPNNLVLVSHTCGDRKFNALIWWT